MPNVNLIAARRAEKKRVEKNTRRLLFGFAVEVVALVLLGMYLGVQRVQIRGGIAAADAKMIRLQPTLDRIAAIEKDMAVSKPKLDTLLSAKADTLRWRAMLQIVSQSVPGNAWLSAISAAGTGDETTITLAGVAGSQTLVGETMTRLQSYPVFDKVELRFTQLASGADDPVRRFAFEIGAHLKSTRPAESAAPAAGEQKSSAPAGDPKQAAQSGDRSSSSKGGNDNGKPSA